MAENEKNNVIKYKKRFTSWRVDVYIFAFIFVYILVFVIRYFQTEHLSGYEVKKGSLSVNNVYRGIALRDEEVFPASEAGYVYYFAPECTHVALGDLVYAIDSSGSLIGSLDNGTTQALTNDDLSTLRNHIMNYQGVFDVENFDTVYNVSHELKNEVARLSNTTMMASLDRNTSLSGVDKTYSPKAGTLVFSSDGFEQKKPADLTAEDFDEMTYENRQFVSGDLLGKGDSAFKLVKNEDWEVVIRVEPERVKDLEEEGYVLVKFLADQFKAWGKVTVYGPDSEDDNPMTLVGLTFTNSMIDYASNRFLDIELELEEETGLKIPNSAIAERNFFLVDEEFMMKGPDNGEDGVSRRSFKEDGTETTQFVATTVYNTEEDEKTGKVTYYLDESPLQIGDTLFDQEGNTMAVSKQASLIGVYNINKGYADFKQVRILYQNEEYSIVESGTKYGLTPYDYIALDSSTVVDNQLIYE